MTIKRLDYFDLDHDKVMFQVCKSTDVDKLEARIEELIELLRFRDGGAHDVDCKYQQYGRSCNCGHESVIRALQPNKEGEDV